MALKTMFLPPLRQRERRDSLRDGADILPAMPPRRSATPIRACLFAILMFDAATPYTLTRSRTRYTSSAFVLLRMRQRAHACARRRRSVAAAAASRFRPQSDVFFRPHRA